jgi:hypothetical protein
MKAPFVGEFIEHLHNVLPGRGWWRLEDGDEAYWASHGEGSGTTVVSTLKRMRRGGSGGGETDLGGGAAKELRKMERTSAATGFLRQGMQELNSNLAAFPSSPNLAAAVCRVLI